MRVGASLSLFALGAILAFAVRSNPSGFDFNTAGWVLMFVGAVGVALTAWWTNQRRTSQVITRTPAGTRETIYVTPNEPIDSSPL
ncbi:MAG: DUF6458 family protein [Jatrophihabitans sp.]|uniref:DUF6458 family protein n=1 Tax=Jatrophihabitans sp. TaxID=1932789 RepID=UPI003F7F7257